MPLSKIDEAGWGGTQLGGRRNIVINGDLKIWQRGTSRVSSSGYLADRLYTYAEYGGLNYTVAKSSDVPAGQGFVNSISVTADEAIGLNLANYVMHRYYIESQDIDHLAYGTSSAKTCTLSFWVKCPRTGNLTISFAHNGLGSQRQISRQISIASANTWQKVEVTIPGDTVRAINSAGSTSSGMFWDIMFNLQNSWSSGASLNENWQDNDTPSRAVGQTQFLQDSGDACFITGMQFEVGDQATPYEHRSYGEELALCERYYQVIDLSNSPMIQARVISSNRIDMSFNFKTEMRVSPTELVVSGMTGIAGFLIDNQTSLTGDTNQGDNGWVLVHSTKSVGTARLWANESMTANRVALAQPTGSIGFGAEI